MRAARVAALRAFPLPHHFLLNKVAMGDWLEPAARLGIPFFLSVAQGANWEIAYALLAEIPELTCIICDHGCWGEDRRFRPLIERYPNVYIDTSQYLLDGGIEAFVERYGPERMLFGSGFPGSYFGGMMLAIRHAEISAGARAAIAGGNLERLLAWGSPKVEVQR
jgi:predicted TIM-barrel fold metal-dependent hydrolase